MPEDITAEDTATEDIMAQTDTPGITLRKLTKHITAMNVRNTVIPYGMEQQTHMRGIITMSAPSITMYGMKERMITRGITVMAVKITDTNFIIDKLNENRV
jgi:hypothetical protein